MTEGVVRRAVFVGTHDDDGAVDLGDVAALLGLLATAVGQGADDLGARSPVELVGFERGSKGFLVQASGPAGVALAAILASFSPAKPPLPDEFGEGARKSVAKLRQRVASPTATPIRFAERDPRLPPASELWRPPPSLASTPVPEAWTPLLDPLPPADAPPPSAPEPGVWGVTFGGTVERLAHDTGHIHVQLEDGKLVKVRVGQSNFNRADFSRWQQVLVRGTTESEDPGATVTAITIEPVDAPVAWEAHPLSEVAKMVEADTARVDSMLHLQGWEGAKVGAAIAQAARRFLAEAARAVVARGLSWRSPLSGPTHDGTILLEWETDVDAVLVEIPDGRSRSLPCLVAGAAGEVERDVAWLDAVGHVVDFHAAVESKLS